MVDKKELQAAIEDGDEKKIYFLFSEMADSMGYKKAFEYEDWKMIVIARAFRYIPKYTKERGAAFSFFYRIMYTQFMYEYRSTVRGKYRSKISFYPLLDNEEHWDEKDLDEPLVSVGGRLFDKDEVRRAYRLVKKERSEYIRKKKFKEILGE